MFKSTREIAGDCAIIDLDSGTVLGSNVMFVRLDSPEKAAALNEASMSDALAFNFAAIYGEPLFVKCDDAREMEA